MQDMTRQLMRATFDKLSQEQLDDIESQFENMEVIFQSIVEESHGPHKTHLPALELHAGELTETLYNTIVQMMSANIPDQLFLLNMKMAIWDYMKGCLVFGRQVGKLGWPVMEVPCEEAHNRD